MEKTVFWSWQSDLDGRVTRDVIRFALDAAITMLSADVEEADRPSLTSDTQGVAGTPDIVATIYRKIDEAGVFVADVTPIAVSADRKPCANPNVLLEMGYANRALTEHRVIQVWNTAFEGATLDKLPFDMRGRRGPISFHLPANAETAELRRVRGDLAKHLAAALKLSLDQLPSPPAEAVHWQPHHPGDPDLWFDRAQAQTVTNRQHGSSKVRWEDHFPGYARLIPSKWSAKPGTKESIASAEGHPALLADANTLGFGVRRGGAMIYWPSTKQFEAYPTIAITQWFEKTGEFWGVGGGFLFEREGRVTLATGSFFKQWLGFLLRNGTLALEQGGALPIHVRLGVSNLANSWWPRGDFQFGDEGHQAVEPSFEFDATLTSVAQEELIAVAVDAFNALAAVYGVEPHTADQIVRLSR